MTLSEGDCGVYFSFSELEESDLLFSSLSKLSTIEERSRYLKMILSSAAYPTTRIGPDNVLITEISDQSISGVRGISYDARVTKPEDQTLFYQKRCLYLEISKKHYEVELFVDNDTCSEDLLAFSKATLSSAAVRQGVFLGQYAAFR